MNMIRPPVPCGGAVLVLVSPSYSVIYDYAISPTARTLITELCRRLLEMRQCRLERIIRSDKIDINHRFERVR